MKKNKLLIVDGTAQIYRAFYGIKTLTDPKGNPVNAAYGFTSVILNLLKQIDPTHLVIAFDRPEPTHRHKKFPQYKAQRQKPPEELIAQIPIIKEITESFQFNACEQAGLEADDIISTIAVQAAKEKTEVIILTSDKDLFQIVNKYIHVMRPVHGGKGTYERLDPDGVRQVFGVGPEHVTDVLALMGDTSDNIPGVPGVGVKTAVDLINTHGSLNMLYHQLESISKVKLKEKLIAHQESAWQSYELVQVLTEANIDLDWHSCPAPSTIPAAAVDLLTQLGFKRLLALMNQAPSVQLKTWETGLELHENIDHLCKQAKTNKQLAIDIVGNQLILGANEKDAVQMSVDLPTLSQFLKTKPSLVACLVDKSINKISYDFKPIMIACYELGQPTQGQINDLHLAAHLLDLPANNIERFVERLLGNSPEKSKLGLMACALIKCSSDIEKQLKKAQALSVYHDLELPLLPVLALMEWNGVALDVKAVNKMGKQFGSELIDLEKKIQSMAGMEFNIRSPQQLSEVLFEHLNLSPGKKTKTGRSTSVDVLEALAHEHPLPAKVLEFRKMQKIKSTYLDVLPKLLSPSDQRLHTTFHQVGAATGRLSSTDPNLQNIPVRTEVGRKIRAMFIPAKSTHKLLSADYSQIELRLLAHLSKDKQMLEDFKQGVDIHQAMAAEIFNVPLEDVNSDMRRQAKTCNFGIAYGVSPFGLAKQIGVSLFRAKEFIEGFYSRYPQVRPYLDGILEAAREHGFVSTLLGRRRATPDIQSANRMVREASERMAINTPIQGSAADIIKLAMMKVAEALETEGFKSKMILQVHDELLFEGPQVEMEKLKTTIIKQMSQVYHLSVELIVEATYGDNWMMAHG